MLATIHDDTWNVLNMQHIIPNSKRWDYSDITNGGHKKIKGPIHMVEGSHHLRKAPNPHPLWYNHFVRLKINQMIRKVCNTILLKVNEMIRNFISKHLQLWCEYGHSNHINTCMCPDSTYNNSNRGPLHIPNIQISCLKALNNNACLVNSVECVSILTYTLYAIYGVCVINWPTSLLMITKVFVLDFIIIMTSEIWFNRHCLGLIHEPMACAVCFLCSYNHLFLMW